MSSTSTIILIPTFNNGQTICDIVCRVKQVWADVMVVNDGSTDDTLPRLNALRNDMDFELVSYAKNRGKGGALKAGFRRAVELGFTHVLTLDADGQHYPEDIPLLMEAGRLNPEAIIVGSRTLTDTDVPSGSIFANKFSNFWFTVQTLKHLPDTQSGFRLYPLNHIGGCRILTSRYEAELELLVFSAWRGTKIVPVPIRVYYPAPEERVSHFRPVMDFVRITVLNTLLCVLAVVYGIPRMLLTKLFGWLISLLYTLFAATFYLVVAFFYQAFAFLWSHIGTYTERRRLFFHDTLCRLCRFCIHHVPGASFTVSNPHAERVERPAIIISNHQSQLDLAAILSIAPKTIILTKQWVWNNPLYSLILRAAEFYPVSERYDECLPHLQDLIQRGYSIVIFPEGTRSADGQVHRFHKGAFQLARDFNLDILPVFLKGLGDVLPKGKLMLRRGHMMMEVGERINSNDAKWGTTVLEQARLFRRYYVKHIEEMA